MQQIIQQLEQLQERYQLSSSTKGGLERERAKTNKQAAGKTEQLTADFGRQH